MIPKSVVLVVALAVIGSRSVSAIKCFTCSDGTCTNEATMGNVADCSAADVSCFSQFTGYLLTRRGCLSELAGAECSGVSCETCNTDYCNEKSRSDHTCVTCSSVTDERCTSDPAAIAATQCAAASIDVTEAQCYSRIIGHVTERGCILSEQAVEACTGESCATCTGSGCNNAEFPTGRQKCVSCGATLACNSDTDTGYCELASDNCVTLQRDDGTYVKSCESTMSTTDQTFCQANPGKCSYCGMLECNKAELNLATSRKCYQCEGTGCLQTAVDIETCHNSDDVCFSIFDGFNPIYRGCYSQLSESEKLKCDEGDTDCQLCDEDGCNLDSHADHKCQYCSSVYDTNCVTAPNNEVRCPAPTTEVSSDAQCYTRVIGSVTERGCLGSAANALECDPTENCETCAIEGGASCNKAIFPEDRIRCVVGSTANTYCPNPSDSCVQIANNGATITKKCESSMTATEVSFCKANGNKCDFCWADNCNQQTITFNYLECYDCDSSVDPHCTTNHTAIDALDHCTTCVTQLATSTNVLKRGCLSALSTTEQAACSLTSSTCTTCSTNRCNGLVYPSDRMSCYSCAEGECHSHEGVALEYCPNYVQGDSCVTRFDSSGSVSWMGCLSSLSSSVQSSCSSSSATCKTCTTAGCNNPAYHIGAASCVQCTSSTDSDCVGGVSSYVVQPCNDPQNVACYSRLTTSGATERGCFNDLSSSYKIRCLAGADCRMCNTRARCNNLEFPIQIKCHQCDSTTNAECKNAQLGDPSYCSTYNPANKCFTIVQENGDTVRKCGTGTRAETCGSSTQCEQCLFSGCNKRVSTAIMSTVIAETVVPGKTNASGRVVVTGFANLVAMIVVSWMVRSVFMR